MFEQDSILELYRMDVSRYARGDTLYVRDIFDQIPSQLSIQGKRFAFSSIRLRGTFDDFAWDFLWLVNTGVALEVRNVSEPRHPLRLSENRKLFKLFMNDVGLLSATWSTTGRWPTCPSTWPRCSDGGANSGWSTCGACRRASAARRALGRLLEVSGGNPFALLFEIGLDDLIAKWHPTKNGIASMDSVSHRAGDRAWWLCPDCGYEWQATVATRSAGYGRCKRCREREQNNKKL